MSNAEDTAVALETNFQAFKSQARKIGANRFTEVFNSWLDGEDTKSLVLAPASTRLDLVCAYPGGLVEHSLRVLMNMAKLRTAFGLQDTVPTKSLVLVSLFHDLGKAGTESKDFYIDNDSQWHRDKLGQMYNINEQLHHWTPSQLSLFRLAQLGVQLDKDEWYSISTIGMPKTRGDDVPTNGEPMLSVLLQQAVKLACIQGKGKKSATVIG